MNGVRQAALAVFCQMPVLKVRQDVIAFNTAIDSCGKWTLAIAFLQQMNLSELETSMISISSAMLCCRRQSAWQQALALHRPGNSFCDSIAIGACEDGNQWTLALAICSSSESDVCVHAAMNAMGAVKRWEISLCLLHAMAMSSLVPSYLAHIGRILFRSCSNSFHLGFLLDLRHNQLQQCHEFRRRLAADSELLSQHAAEALGRLDQLGHCVHSLGISAMGRKLLAALSTAFSWS